MSFTKPPLPRAVLILTADCVLIPVTFSILTLRIPPDISLPRAMPAESGEMQVRRRMTRSSVGIPNLIPYWSHPLLTAMQSSPETIKQSSIRVLKQESVKLSEELGKGNDGRRKAPRI